MNKFLRKMIIQVQFNGDLTKKYFANTGIWTHDLQAHVFLPGQHLPHRNLQDGKILYQLKKGKGFYVYVISLTHLPA